MSAFSAFNPSMNPCFTAEMSKAGFEIATQATRGHQKTTFNVSASG
jgi:hypothetical protein